MGSLWRFVVSRWALMGSLWGPLTTLGDSLGCPGVHLGYLWGPSGVPLSPLSASVVSAVVPNCRHSAAVSSEMALMISCSLCGSLSGFGCPLGSLWVPCCPFGVPLGFLWAPLFTSWRLCGLCWGPESSPLCGRFAGNGFDDFLFPVWLFKRLWVPIGIPVGPLWRHVVSRWAPPDASRCLQMPPEASRCFQLPPRCLPDASLMLPEVSRSLQLPLVPSRCLQMSPDAPQMLMMMILMMTMTPVCLDACPMMPPP